MSKPSYITCCVLASSLPQPMSSTETWSLQTSSSIASARSSFATLVLQDLSQRALPIKHKKKRHKKRVLKSQKSRDVCPAMWVPDGLDHPRSFSLRRNTTKEWTYGALAAFYMSSSPSQCFRNNQIWPLKRSQLYFRVIIAILLLQKMKRSLAQMLKTSLKLYWRPWAHKMTYHLLSPRRVSNLSQAYKKT